MSDAALSRDDAPAPARVVLITRHQKPADEGNAVT